MYKRNLTSANFRKALGLGVGFTTFETIGPIPKLTRDFEIYKPALKKVLLILSNHFCNVINELVFHLERAA